MAHAQSRGAVLPQLLSSNTIDHLWTLTLPTCHLTVANVAFTSAMPRLTKPKPLEPYHRDRYGAELNSGPLSGFNPRPLLTLPS